MSETEQKSLNSLEANGMPKEIESDITTIERSSELEKLITITLEQIESISHEDDLTDKNILNVLENFNRKELLNFDTVYNEVQSIKKLQDNNNKQMQAVDQDIADIFMDLHNIYMRLEKLDKSGRKLSSPKKSQLLKHVKESENLLSRSRHYLSNDPREMNAMLVGPPKEPE
ncbi:uncharacterized protein LOC108105770 [Drosophila eugracilis]|uniref:uncharacterized protein LOC108105770 n=1 Tax=Drosophila eugracilis TaxID=29029 RepID=UPI0007E68761|nr:uncharacterized protein LOC108105770 [Drosophila eugracilis]